MAEYPHEWVLDEEGRIDIWQLDADYHNGPQCTRCERAFCQHCNREIYEEECPVASVQPTLFESQKI